MSRDALPAHQCRVVQSGPPMVTRLPSSHACPLSLFKHVTLQDFVVDDTDVWFPVSGSSSGNRADGLKLLGKVLREWEAVCGAGWVSVAVKVRSSTPRLSDEEVAELGLRCEVVVG